jgi:hypothetical protein
MLLLTSYNHCVVPPAMRASFCFGESSSSASVGGIRATSLVRSVGKEDQAELLVSLTGCVGSSDASETSPPVSDKLAMCLALRFREAAVGGLHLFCTDLSIAQSPLANPKNLCCGS